MCQAPQHRVYLFGFNGMQKDDEVKGSGNSYDFGARIYDPRLGRFMSVDPLYKKQPWSTSYSFAANSPIKLIDKFGLKPEEPPTSFVESWDKSKTTHTYSDNRTIYLVNDRWIYEQKKYLGSNSELTYQYFDHDANEWQNFTPITFKQYHAKIMSQMDNFFQGMLYVGFAGLSAPAFSTTTILSATAGERALSGSIDFGMQMTFAEGNLSDRFSSVNRTSVIMSIGLGAPTLGNYLTNGLISNSFQYSVENKFQSVFTGDISTADVVKNTLIEGGLGELGKYTVGKLSKAGTENVNFAKFLFNHDTYTGSIKQNFAIGSSYLFGKTLQSSGTAIDVASEAVEQKITK